MRRMKRLLQKLQLAPAPTPLTTQQLIQRYQQNGYIPWSEGYAAYRWEYIRNTLADENILAIFADGTELPPNFAYRLDERPVEYGWVFSQLEKSPGMLLDAGSTFNFEIILDALKPFEKILTIMTLAPEARAFWNRGISYQFGDLRNIPFRDEWFDEVVSISTVEHIGFDNSMYGASPSEEPGDNLLKTMVELLRILRPGGRLLLTVPFGKRQEITINGRAFAQQFDSHLVQELLSYVKATKISTRYYRFCQNGWQLSTADDCKELAYFNVHETSEFDADYAAAARAIACIRIEKP